MRSFVEIVSRLLICSDRMAHLALASVRRIKIGVGGRAKVRMEGIGAAAEQNEPFAIDHSDVGLGGNLHGVLRGR